LHRDILYIMLAGIMLGGVVLLSQVFLRGTYYGSMGSHRRYSSGGRGGGGQAQAVMAIIAIAAAILAPLMAQLLYFAVSRRREYLADAGAVRLTRYPEGLASALEKIANDPAPQLATVNNATAPMYIANPFKRRGQKTLADLTSTHPPITERIRILRSMAQGASFRDYAQAFAAVTHARNVIPAAALTKEEVKIREGRVAPAPPETARKQVREMGDLMRKVNGFAFLTCPCSLKLKIPPNFHADTVRCPRCSRTLSVSSARAPQRV
jgi:heat shock protein HtpX